MFENIKKDIVANHVSKARLLCALIVPNAFNALLWIRLHIFLEKHHIPTFLTFRYLYHVHSLEVAENLKIGGGLGLPHPRGILFCKGTEIGERVIMNGNVRFTARAGAAPKIGDGTFIGDGALFLGVSEVGPHSAVGAASVVTKKFAGNVVICGNPARFMKNRFPVDENGKLVIR